MGPDVFDQPRPISASLYSTPPTISMRTRCCMVIAGFGEAILGLDIGKWARIRIATLTCVPTACDRPPPTGQRKTLAVGGRRPGLQAGVQARDGGYLKLLA